MIDADKILSITKKAVYRNGNLDDFRRTCKILNLKGIPYFKIVSGSKAYIIQQNNDFVKYFHADWTNKRLADICRRTSLDARKFLKANDLSYQKPFFPITDYNHKVIKESVGEMVKSFDMKACYWNTALRLGIISEKTFAEGIDAPKEMRLMALGSFAKSIFISRVENGKSVEKLNYKSEKIAVWYRVLEEVDRIYNKATDVVGIDNYLMWRTDQIIFNQKMTAELTKAFRQENIQTRKDIIQITNYDKSTLSGIYLNRPVETDFNVFVPSIVNR